MVTCQEVKEPVKTGPISGRAVVTTLSIENINAFSQNFEICQNSDNAANF